MLVIACPHALGLAIPLVIAISTERAAKNGVLVKDRLALERMRTIDVGAVRQDRHPHARARHAVTDIAAAGVSEAELLSLAAAAEADSEHPVARAIVAAAAEHPEASGMRRRGTDFSASTGRGVRATVDGCDHPGRRAHPAARAGAEDAVGPHGADRLVVRAGSRRAARRPRRRGDRGARPRGQGPRRSRQAAVRRAAGSRRAGGDDHRRRAAGGRGRRRRAGHRRGVRRGAAAGQGHQGRPSCRVAG